MGIDNQFFTSRVREDFLRVLAATGNASKAARAIGMNYSTVSRHRASDEAFAEMWSDALHQFHKDFEEAAAQRAQFGVREPIVHQGKFVRWPEDHPEAGKIAYTVRYSDSLVPVLLKGHEPERHRDRSDVRVKGALQHSELSDAEIISRAEAILEDSKVRAEGERPDGVTTVAFRELPPPVSAEDLI